MKNSEQGPHSPLWTKPEPPTADQLDAEARAAELGEIMRARLSAPDGPAFAALLNAEFARRGCLYRVHRKTGVRPRR
jgi:hypothetical protein